MDSSLLEIGENLKRAITTFVVPIQTTKEVNEVAFSDLEECAMSLVRACKFKENIPKSLLRELLAVFTILRNEAAYLGAKAGRVEEMANSIEACFRLILADEVPEDRQPGVPRIV